MRPHSYHQWRQCDGAMFALNYYSQSMDFFEPRLSCLAGNDGKMVSEFPIIYYTAACLYKVFGFHEWFIRLISLLFFYSGLYSLYKIAEHITGSFFYAVWTTLLLFSSALIAYYANNFLPDVPGLSLCFTGMYFLLRYRNTQNKLWLFISMAVFTLCGLIKLTAIISFLTIGCIALMQEIIATDPSKKVFRSGLFKPLHILFFVLPLLLCMAWYQYASWYNVHNQNTYFLLKTLPIWKIDKQDMMSTLARFDWEWMKVYMNKPAIIALGILLVLAFVVYRRKLLWEKSALFILTIGLLADLLLFFPQFYHHDYYAVVLMVIFPAVVLYWIYSLKQQQAKLISSKVFMLCLGVLLGLNFLHAKKQMVYRYEQQSEGVHFDSYKTIEPYLNELGVKQEDLVVSAGDISTGISLYLMNRRGWTDYALNGLTEENVRKAIGKGAKYLTMDDYRSEKKHLIQPLLTDSIGRYKSVTIYRLH